MPPTPMDAPPVSRWAQPGPIYSAPTGATAPTGAGLDGVWASPSTDAPALPWGTAPAPALQPTIPVRRIIDTYSDDQPTDARVPFPPRRTSRKSQTTVATTTTATTTTRTSRGIRGRGGHIGTRGTSRSVPAPGPSKPEPSRPTPTGPSTSAVPALTVTPVVTVGVPGSSREGLDMVSVVTTTLTT